MTVREAKLGSSRRRVEHDPVELFTPILGMLIRSGLKEKELTLLFARAMKRAKANRSGPQVYRVDSEYLSADLLHRWMRDPKYLNAAGKPLDLPLRGPISIASLVSESSVTGSPNKIVDFMLNFKNIRRTRSGTYRLLRRSLNYKIPKLLPFEPNFEFLVDAARACTRGIGLNSKAPEVFWQRADSLQLNSSQAKRFIEFAETRGMLFMHEMNDWLDQHSSRKPDSRGKKLRVGVGYFGISRNL